ARAELAAVGVAFVSLRDNLALSTPGGRLMFQIIAAMAEFERALIPFGIAPGHFQFSVTRFQLLYPDHFPLLCLAMNYGSKLLKVRRDVGSCALVGGLHNIPFWGIVSRVFV